MNRRTFLASLTIAAALLVASFTTFTGQASAQVPVAQSCCTFTVDVAGFPAACFPATLMTRWGAGTQNNIIPGNGVFVFNVTAVACPPPPQFWWASLNAGVTKAWFNFPAVFQVNGCCWRVRVGKTAAGCMTVVIRPC